MIKKKTLKSDYFFFWVNQGDHAVTFRGLALS